MKARVVWAYAPVANYSAWLTWVSAFVATMISLVKVDGEVGVAGSWRSDNDDAWWQRRLGVSSLSIFVSSCGWPNGPVLSCVECCDDFSPGLR